MGSQVTPAAEEAAASLRWWIVALALASVWRTPAALGGGGERGEGRLLLGFTETNGNASFRCSPSGLCIRCKQPEKNDEKRRCSETGYHAPLRCTRIGRSQRGEIKNRVKRRLSSVQEYSIFDSFRRRKLLDDSSNQNSGNNSYIKYRSCVPVNGEEKLSVLGFEVIMVGLLLISGPIIYLRRRRTAATPDVGFTRIPANASAY